MASASVHFKGGDSAVVYLLFIVAPIVCGEFVLSPCLLLTNKDLTQTPHKQWESYAVLCVFSSFTIISLRN